MVSDASATGLTVLSTPESPTCYLNKGAPAAGSGRTVRVVKKLVRDLTLHTRGWEALLRAQCGWFGPENTAERVSPPIAHLCREFLVIFP